MGRWPTVRGHAVVWIRVGIAIMVLDHAYNGIWGVASPDSYYRALPGSNRSAAVGALNRVIVRDLGAGRLTLAVLLVIAALWMHRDVLTAALAAALVSGVVRLADHLAHRPGDAWPNWVGFSLAVALPVVLLALIWARTSSVK
jgi:hypothetical protein